MNQNKKDLEGRPKLFLWKIRKFMKKIRTIRTFFIKNPHIPYISEIIRTIRTFKKKIRTIRTKKINF